MKDYKDVQLILEPMLLEAFQKHVHHTVGSFSQIFQDGLLSHSFIEAACWICSGMISILTYMFDM